MNEENKQNPRVSFNIGLSMITQRLLSVLVILTFISVCGCTESANEPKLLKPIEGVWEESYEYETPPWEYFGSETQSISGKTSFTFNGNEVKIKILPSTRAFGFDSLGHVKTMLKVDTVYIGNYSLSKDTLILKIKGFSNQDNFLHRFDTLITKKYKWKISNDTLNIKFIPFTQDSFAVVPLGDWLWAGSHQKASGKFTRK